MADIIRKFGSLIDDQAIRHPRFARYLFTAGLRAFGLKLDLRPDPKLPPSRKYLASIMNHTVTDLLTHTGQSALVSLFTPCQMLHAMEIRSLCAELYSAFVNGAHAERAFVEQAEREGVAETFCSYHKVLLGSVYTGMFPKPGFIVNTSLACDANNLTFRAIARHTGAEQFYIDVPPFRSPDSIAYVADTLKELGVFLEDQTHKKLDPEKLRESVARSERTLANLRRSAGLRAVHTLAGDIASEMYEIFMSHIALGSEQAENYSQKLLRDLETSPGPEGIRILWVHTIPNWQQPLRETFNFSDQAHIIWSDLNFENLSPMDPDKPYESMAARLVDSSFNGSGSRRIDLCVQMARQLNVDGVVIFCHWGCKQTAGISTKMKQAMEAEGFPALILNGDGCDENNASDGQVSTRMNAFLEMLGEQ